MAKGGNMQFKENAHVFTASGQDVGKIKRIVVDPKSKEMTHLVVQKGFLFTDDKVIPLDEIETATEEKVVLKEGREDLDKFPDFEETHYVKADEDHTPAHPDADELGPLAWYYPLPGGAWWSTHMGAYPGYQPPPYVLKTELNIPEGTVPLEEGSKVFSLDGAHVGNVERVYADEAEQRVTHLLVSKGLISKSQKLIPSMWVASVSENVVRLSVDEALIERLPEYAPRD
jgi:uncharacterized protein YrrD